MLSSSNAILCLPQLLLHGGGGSHGVLHCPQDRGVHSVHKAKHRPTPTAGAPHYCPSLTRAVCVHVYVYVCGPMLCGVSRCAAAQFYTVPRKYQIPNTKYTCDTGQTRNKLLEQWVHLANHAAGHSGSVLGSVLAWKCFCFVPGFLPADNIGHNIIRPTSVH